MLTPNSRCLKEQPDSWPYSRTAFGEQTAALSASNFQFRHGNSRTISKPLHTRLVATSLSSFRNAPFGKNHHATTLLELSQKVRMPNGAVASIEITFPKPSHARALRK